MNIDKAISYLEQIQARAKSAQENSGEEFEKDLEAIKKYIVLVREELSR